MSAVLVSSSPSARAPTWREGPAPEFDFAARDFERVRTLIRERAGIHLQSGKHAMMYSRLSRRLRETGHRSAASYLEGLERNAGSNEWQQFVNCLTTNRTAFFREDHHFECSRPSSRRAAARRSASGAAQPPPVKSPIRWP